MKYHWRILLTQEQLVKLKAGLLSRFCGQLRLEIATVEYDFEVQDLSVYIGTGTKPDNILDLISSYINGFAKAIEA